MLSRGRKTADALMAGMRSHTRLHLPPPEDFGEAQRELWITIVNSRSPDYFLPEHAPLLRQYVLEFENSQEFDALIKKQIKRMKATRPTVKSLVELSRLIKLQARHSTQLLRFGRSLRLTPSATYDKTKKRNNMHPTRGQLDHTANSTEPRKKAANQGKPPWVQ